MSSPTLRLALFTFIIGAIGAPPLTAANAAGPEFSLRHSFCQENVCDDGFGPSAGLVRDNAGNLYGTFASGGHATSWGGVYELTPNNGLFWDYKIIATFCRRTDCKDGGFPATKLIIDTKGNLYGTAGGGSVGGAVFELIPDATHTHWTHNTLHVFCNGTCADGANPLALSYAGAATGLPYDGVSPLYGSTQLGGVGHGGTVFSLTPPAAGATKWNERTLYSFCAVANCTDGFTPTSSVLVDPAGNLYGTTSGGGAKGKSGTPEGVLYKLAPSGHVYNYSILYSFCRKEECKDGSTPAGTLVMDSHGTIFGEAGGGNLTGNQLGGVLYSFNGTEAVVHTFCLQKGCTDGQAPAGGLMRDADGNIFGATVGGQGVKNSGTIFRLSGTVFTTLHTFCRSTPKCRTGNFPNGDLIFDAAGNIAGTTASGGFNGGGFSGGTVLELGN